MCRLSKSERQRLEREEYEARGFVSNLERLLLTVDDSANGKFAARIAGLLAGPRGMPITVLPLKPADKATKSDTESKQSASAEVKEVRSADVVKAAAEKTRNGNQDETPLSPPDVTVREPEEPPEQALATEMKKGYDLLIAAIETMQAKNGGFNPDLAPLMTTFDGPVTVIAARGAHLERPTRSRLNILVPVTGTEVSQRAADFAIALARATNAPIKALYVNNAKSNGRRSRRDRRQEHSILRDVIEQAEKQGQEIRTAVRTDIAPDQAIVQEAKRGGHDLIIMGVNKRPGETLYFGDTAAAVFEQSGSSVLFLAS